MVNEACFHRDEGGKGRANLTSFPKRKKTQLLYEGNKVELDKDETNHYQIFYSKLLLLRTKTLGCVLLKGHFRLSYNFLPF